MTVSTTNVLQFTLNEIIAEAFDVIGVGSEGEAITPDMYRRGKNSLNLMIMSWNAMPDLWRQEQITVSLLDSVAEYTFDDPKPLRITSARRELISGGNQTPMIPWSRQEYLDQPNKLSSPSTPVNFYYDPQRDEGKLYLWPSPQASVAAQNVVIIDTLRPMFLMDVSTDTLDFPIEWQETVVYNLAQRLMMKYPVNDPNVAGQINGMAADLFAKLKGWDNEPTSLYLQPNYQAQGGFGEWR